MLRNLKMDEWRRRLIPYSGENICDYLEFGWPVVFISCKSRPESQVSFSLLGPHSHFIQVQPGHNTVLGPFHSQPFKEFQVSLLMTTRPKENSEARRVIMNLSFPAGNSAISGIKTDSYYGKPYQMHIPTVYTMAERLSQLKTDCTRRTSAGIINNLDWNHCAGPSLGPISTMSGILIRALI